MTGPPCGELSRYLDELRAQRKAEAVADETVVVPDNCMAMVEPEIYYNDGEHIRATWDMMKEWGL